jgi:hypothetical protein
VAELWIGATVGSAGVSLRRGDGIPIELWNSLGRNIAPGSTVIADADQIVVPVERFLAKRNWLGATLNSYGCTPEVDITIRGLLDRADREREQVKEALDGARPTLDSEQIRKRLDGTRFIRDLKPFQIRDAGRILSLSHGANFSVPGAGKTTVAYAVYEAEHAAGRVARMLVVAPLSAFDAWLGEVAVCFDPAPKIERFEGKITSGTEIVLVNYQRLAANYGVLAEWVLEADCLVVLDEAHRMKRGRDGEWGSRCLDLAHLAARRDILTGTPAPQHPSDFSSLMEFVWPHQSRRILPAETFQREPSAQTLTAISNRLKPLFSRTSKDELGLKPPQIRAEVLEMKPLQKEIYEALRTKMRRALGSSAGERSRIGDLGSVVMYLLEGATNPGLLAEALGGEAPGLSWPAEPIPAGSALAEKILEYGRLETPRKFEKLAALVAANAARGRKTLVWSNFIGNLIELAERVLLPYHPALIYGAIPSGEDPDRTTRESELRRFREEDRCQVLLANPAAMSEGVSLHMVCHDAVYLERTFNAGQYLQSIDRIHRLGLPAEAETRVTFLVSAGTVDETVDERVAIKAKRLGEMLSDRGLATMSLPDEEGYGEWIDTEDVSALFRHLEDS